MPIDEPAVYVPLADTASVKSSAEPLKSSVELEKPSIELQRESPILIESVVLNKSVTLEKPMKSALEPQIALTCV